MSLPRPSLPARSGRRRALALGAALGCLGGLGLWGLRGSLRAPGSGGFQVDGGDLFTTLEDVPSGFAPPADTSAPQGAVAPAPAPPAHAFLQPPAGLSAPRRRKLTREQYALVESGPMQNELVEWDPQTYYRWKPHIELRRPWAEHPDGHWTLATNAEGWREDVEFGEGRGDPCVIMTGDSHADGMCNNAESFCNLIEDDLRRANPERDPRCWNAAKSGYTFFFYLGLLEKLAERAPDLFVVSVYGGNDFCGGLALLHAFEPELHQTARTIPYRKRRAEGLRLAHNPMMQGFNDLHFFAEFPHDVPFALRSAQEVTLAMQRLCDERGIDFLVVYLPALIDFRADEWAELRAVLELEEADLAVTEQLGRDYLEYLAQNGIDAVDLTALLAGQSELAWEQDRHLNVAGQREVARALAPVIAERLGLNPPAQ